MAGVRPRHRRSLTGWDRPHRWANSIVPAPERRRVGRHFVGARKRRGWRARQRHPKALLAEDRKWAPPTRPPGDLSPSVPLSGSPGPRFALSGSARTKASLRCATRTAGRSAGGFPGRHPGTAAGPSSRLLAARDSAGAGADYLPRRPAPVPGRRPSAGRDGRRIREGLAAGTSVRVMPGMAEGRFRRSRAAGLGRRRITLRQSACAC